MTLVDQEKVFDFVLRRVIWWPLHKLGLEEWLGRLMQSMYEDARSRVVVGSNLSEKFNVKGRVHQGSCPSHVSSRFWKPSPKSFARDVAGKTGMQMTWPSSLKRWRNCKSSWSSVRLARKEWNFGPIWVNQSSDNVSKPGRYMLQKSSKDPCAMCLSGVGTNLLWRLFQLGPRVMQWYLWHSGARSHL